MHMQTNTHKPSGCIPSPTPCIPCRKGKCVAMTLRELDFSHILQLFVNYLVVLISFLLIKRYLQLLCHRRSCGCGGVIDLLYSDGGVRKRRSEEEDAPMKLGWQPPEGSVLPSPFPPSRRERLIFVSPLSFPFPGSYLCQLILFSPPFHTSLSSL